MDLDAPTDRSEGYHCLLDLSHQTRSQWHQDLIKTRLVAPGFQQWAGIDCTETFTPIVKWETIRLIIGISAHCGWQIKHLDVQATFFYSIITKPVYFMQPQGFTTSG